MAKSNRTPWIDLVSQNVQALPAMTQTHVREDIQRTARDGDLLVFQEIMLDRYAVELHKIGTLWEVYLPEEPNGGCALAWRRTEWKCLDKGKTLLHEGVAQVSGHRFIVWALLQNRRTGAIILLHTWHYVAGAWNIKDDPNEEEREPLWRQDVRNHLKFLKPYVDECIPIIGGGDANRMFGHRLGPFLGERVGRRKINYIADAKTIDPIFLIHGKEWRWVIDPEGTEHLTDRHSDHGGRKSRQRLVHRKVSK